MNDLNDETHAEEQQEPQWLECWHCGTDVDGEEEELNEDMLCDDCTQGGAYEQLLSKDQPLTVAGLYRLVRAAVRDGLLDAK